MIAEADSGRSTVVEQVRERLAELWSYLTANQKRLINYGREYHEGHRVSTAWVESTVDQVVDWRMEKKQHLSNPAQGQFGLNTRNQLEIPVANLGDNRPHFLAVGTFVGRLFRPGKFRKTGEARFTPTFVILDHCGFPPDVFGLFSNNVGPFSLNLVPRASFILI
jgi:hypothetical protein